MNVVVIVAGALFVVWPLQYRRSMRRIRDRLMEHGRDVEHFDRRMDRWWIRASLGLAPVVGVVFIVFGVIS